MDVIHIGIPYHLINLLYFISMVSRECMIHRIKYKLDPRVEL